MAKKITDLTALTSADPTDVVPIVDVSTNTTKKTTVAGLAPGLENIPTTAYASNSVTPDKLADRDYQTDNNNSITDVFNGDVKLVLGWGQLAGTNAGTLSGTVTFPQGFTTVLGVNVSFQGTKTTTAATSITDFNGNFAASTVMFTIDPQPISTTGFTVNLSRSSGSFSSSTYYGFSWIAWGL